MTTKLTLFGLLFLFLCSCSSPHYLPRQQHIDLNTYGSYIKLTPLKGKKVVGELIAIDSTTIVVLLEEGNKCVVFPVNSVKKFKLHYAKARNYGWSVPVFLVYPLVHGFFSIFTVPLHIIVTTAVTASGKDAYTYSNKNMTYEDLRMFARFPQGIPEQIDLDSLEYEVVKKK